MTAMRAAVALVCLGWLAQALVVPAHATPTRFALVIGNDVADTDGGVDLGALRFAERDALRLRDSLVRWGQFPPDSIEVVIGASRDDVLAAAIRLADRHRAARRQLGDDVPTLFALFFNGHGLDGRLLTARGALSGDDLATIIDGVGATLTFSLFDACYSGAVDLAPLTAKGIVRTPGFNPAAVIPEQLLTSEGLLWFSSSGPGEISYEDPQAGSLFTHYFIEAFTAAERDATGTDLDAMWRFARERTAAHAARHGRSQSPMRRIESLSSTGPLYFSFPAPRSATLTFAAPIEGTFTVRSAGGLVERVIKTPGLPLEFAVYPGELRIGPAGEPPIWGVSVAPGDRLFLDARAQLHSAPPGLRREHLRPLGPSRGQAVVRQTAGSTTQVGVGVTWLPAQPFDRVPDARIEAVAQWTNGPWAFDARVGYAFGRRTFDAWGTELHGGSASVGAAMGTSWTRLRLDARLGLDADVMQTTFSSTEPGLESSPETELTPGSSLWGRAFYPISRVTIGVAAGARVALARDLPPGSVERAVRVQPVVAVDVTLR